MTDKTEEKILVQESNDGSATVEVPENLVDSNDPVVASDVKDGGSITQDDMDHPNDDEDLRRAKRERRKAKKEAVRKMNQEKDVRLTHLQRENAELARRLNQLENHTKAEQIRGIDYTINDLANRIQYAEHQYKEAILGQDGDAALEAQQMMEASKKEMERLQYIRHQAGEELQRPQPKQAPQMPVEVQQHAAEWLKRNPWYKPDMSDSESRIAKKIDEILVSQGWDPSDADYWDELDSRLQRELPHVYNNRNDDDSRNVRRPRNVVASSGREASGAYGGVNRMQFTLSPERVKAMKEAGAWDNPERKARMIKQFMAYDRTSGRNN